MAAGGPGGTTLKPKDTSQTHRNLAIGYCPESTALCLTTGFPTRRAFDVFCYTPGVNGVNGKVVCSCDWKSGRDVGPLFDERDVSGIQLNENGAPSVLERNFSDSTTAAKWV